MRYRTHISKKRKRQDLKQLRFGVTHGGHEFKSYLVYTAILKILALKKHINKARLSSKLSHKFQGLGHKSPFSSMVQKLFLS
jgi:hypothetical protein